MKLMFIVCGRLVRLYHFHFGGNKAVAHSNEKIPNNSSGLIACSYIENTTFSSGQKALCVWFPLYFNQRIQ